MTTIAAPKVHRQWQGNPPLNSATNDYISENGARISLPAYIDLTSSQRKQILNELRNLSSSSVTTSTSTLSGLQVSSPSNAGADVESYIGMSLEVLRGVIFQRGGLEVSLALRLQEATGLEFVKPADFTQAYKERSALVKGYIKEHPYN